MVEKEANALGAVYQLGIDSRKPKKTIERRTVEYAGSLAAWNRVCEAFSGRTLADHVLRSGGASLRPTQINSLGQVWIM